MSGRRPVPAGDGTTVGATTEPTAQTPAERTAESTAEPTAEDVDRALRRLDVLIRPRRRPRGRQARAGATVPG